MDAKKLSAIGVAGHQRLRAHLTEMLKTEQDKLKRMDDPKDLYRSQGSVSVIERLIRDIDYALGAGKEDMEGAAL